MVSAAKRACRVSQTTPGVSRLNEILNNDHRTVKTASDPREGQTLACWGSLDTSEQVRKDSDGTC